MPWLPRMGGFRVWATSDPECRELPVQTDPAGVAELILERFAADQLLFIRRCPLLKARQECAVQDILTCCIQSQLIRPQHVNTTESRMMIFASITENK